MTAACEVSYQYYKIITKFSVLDKKPTYQSLLQQADIFTQFSTEKLLSWQIDC